MPYTPTRALRRVAALVAASMCLAGCAAVPPGTTQAPTGTTQAPTETTGGTPTASATPSAGTPSATKPATGSPSTGATGITACVRQTYASLTREQRLGQLLMVGYATSNTASDLRSAVAGAHVGGLIYLGGWSGASRVKSTSASMQAAATKAATGGVAVLVAADQEGGAIHQLRGTGFTNAPSALEQGKLPPAKLTADATAWARELKDAGVNVNLAPVADTVPAALGTANKPIGYWKREYGHTPKQVIPGVQAFVRGMRAGGVEATVKHFPGLGRVRNNTDFSSTGITDNTATVNDPYLEPFVAGIDAGARLVMVSSAYYPKIDSKNRAMFSSAIVTGLLRDKLGYDGVVITDDVAAQALASVPAGQRGVLAVDAGVDIVLSGGIGDGRALLAGLSAKAKSDPAFAKKAAASAYRVLALKEQMGLLDCGGAR